MLGAVGRNVLISTRAVFYEPEKIDVGENSQVDDFCLVTGEVPLGRNVHLAACTHVAGGMSGVVLADFATCAYACHIVAQTDDFSGRTMANSTVPKQFKHETFAAISIARHTILDTGTTVLPGCDFGDGVSTGAGTVVAKPLDEWTIYVGQPARAVGPRSRELPGLDAQYLAQTAEKNR